MYRTLLAPLAALTLAGTALAQDAPPELPRLSAALKDPGLAAAFDAMTARQHGVLSETDGTVERLTWLGIGGGAESIDGRTILYAALTGSLDNHPQAFNYD